MKLVPSASIVLLVAATAFGQATPAPSAGAAAIADRQAPGAAAGASHESPPILAASAILPAELRSGAHFRVAEEVSNDGYMNHFAIESDYGRFEVTGTALLRVRVREVAAIAQLKEVSKSKVFLEAAAKSAAKPVTAVAAVVADPSGTVKGVPGGVKRAFGRLKNTAGSAAGAAKDAVSDEEEDGDQGDSPVAGGSSGDKAVALAKSYLGVTAAHRKWAEKLGVDPYTSNPTLSRELDGVAKVDRAGGMAAGIAMPGLGSAVGYVTKVSALVWSKDPLELLEINRKQLAAMGVDEDLAGRFLVNRHYTPSKQTALTSALAALNGTADRRYFLPPAVLARSEEEAWFYVEAAQLLAGFHARGGPIAALVPGAVLAAARTRDGKQVTLVPVDHLCWTPELEVLLGRPGQARPEERTIWVGGSLSERARKEIGARGVTPRDQARTTLLAEN